MRAVRMHEYGGPERLVVEEAPEPHPGPGEIRVEVVAASVNRIDGKILSGPASGERRLPEPIGLGFDAAGTVDEVGEGVSGITIGDPVFGLGRQTQAEYAVLTDWAVKPAAVDWDIAGAAGVVAETAIRGLDLLGVGAGSTVLIDGASGGVGAVAVQIARVRGARVIGSASERNAGYLSRLGALPVVYGAGLADRVRAQHPGPLDAVFDVAGMTPIEDLVSLVAEPAQVVSIANFSAGAAGARVTSGGEIDKPAALRYAAELLASGELVIDIQAFPLGRAAEGYQAILTGHTRGKIVLLP